MAAGVDVASGEGGLSSGRVVRVFAVAVKVVAEGFRVAGEKARGYAVVLAALVDALGRRVAHSAFGGVVGSLVVVRVAVAVGSFGAYSKVGYG